MGVAPKPKVLVPGNDPPRPTTIVVPDADHPSRRDVDGEQVIQLDRTVEPGNATPLGKKSWPSLAEVTESVNVQDDSGDTLHIDITYRIESRPAEISEVPDMWIHTERKALLTISTGEHAGATIVGQARIQLAPGEARDPRAAIARASTGADHWAQVYLAEAKQYVNLHGAGGRPSLVADAADSDVLAYDDPLRTLVGLKNILKLQHVAGHGDETGKMHAQAQQLLAVARRGRAILEKEIASIASYHDPQPGWVAPVRFLVGEIEAWLTANQRAGRDDTEDARQLRAAHGELQQLLAQVERTQPPKRNQTADALDAPVRFLDRTGEGIGEFVAMVVDLNVLTMDALGARTGIGTSDYHPISNYGKAVDASNASTTTALVTLVNGFADEWSDAIERAKHGDYRSLTDTSIDTLMMIDGVRTGGVLAIEKAELLSAKLGSVAQSARMLAAALPATASDVAALAGQIPARASDIAAAMADGADAFVARLRASGMQMSTAGSGGGPSPNLGGLSAESLADAAQAAKEAFKETRAAQEAAKHGEQVAPRTDPAKSSRPEVSNNPSSTPLVARVKDRILTSGRDFVLAYTDAELGAIVECGQGLGLPEKMIEDLIYAGSRVKKAITAADLMDQMKNWSIEIKGRGFPYRFDDMAQFRQFSKDLLEGVQHAHLPTDDVRIQGSSLRKATANDVDVAVFVNESEFDELLVRRFDNRISRHGARVSLTGNAHAELTQLAADIEAHPNDYNAQGSTFQNAIKTGIINSKSDIVMSLKQMRAEIANKYPNLNIETISVLLRGGHFDLLPDLPVRAN